MKVKVAEALKYNKKVIASSFTLIGYEQSLESPDIISCNSLSEYKVAIKKLRNMQTTASTTRKLFLQYYSDSACAEYFKRYFNNKSLIRKKVLFFIKRLRCEFSR
jgi:hypothetical protein